MWLAIGAETRSYVWGFTYTARGRSGTSRQDSNLFSLILTICKFSATLQWIQKSRYVLLRIHRPESASRCLHLLFPKAYFWNVLVMEMLLSIQYKLAAQSRRGQSRRPGFNFFQSLKCQTSYLSELNWKRVDYKVYKQASKEKALPKPTLCRLQNNTPLCRCLSSDLWIFCYTAKQL